jgi:hypothetical protein
MADFKDPSIIDGSAQIYKSVSENKQMLGLPLNFLFLTFAEYLILFLGIRNIWIPLVFCLVQIALLGLIGRKDPFLLKNFATNFFRSNTWIK